MMNPLACRPVTCLFTVRTPWPIPSVFGSNPITLSTPTAGIQSSSGPSNY